MGYTALYRKFRPLKFSEIVGQDAITKTLKNQIIADRVGHAYLFNGGRGTGKTTAAKILSRAVNCLNPKDGEPCNECEICKEIINGSLTDVVEMDAASNNSVEDIRGIREEVNFLPTKAKYRVYIIDEVHMLSTGAFNALLKTLEEPPEHVKFILATTEPQKLPATILSRCQRFDFKRISNEDVIKRLKIISDESKINIEENALRTIAVLSEGAMRDAISILERCLQEGEDVITDDMVKELAGVPKLEYINRIINSISNGDKEQTLELTEEILKEGKDLYYFLWEMIKYLKDILVFKSKGKLNLYNEGELKQIEELSNKFSKEGLFEMIYSLSELENNIKWSTQKNIMFQTGILKLMNKNTSEDLEDRVLKLEEKINNIGSIQVKQEPVKKTPEISNKTEDNTPKPVKKPEKTNIPSNSKSADFWSNVINILKSKGKITLFTNLIGTKAIQLNEIQLGISGLTPFGKRVIEDPTNRREIETAIFQETGKEMQIRVVEETKNSNNPNDNTNGMSDIPFNIIDE
ncbi:MAG: DNA polymerase III subunit gamma/tau [Clostridia bacterium]|nr:DNA polymerase III subunit gamma/tau [Clostridia bacterium]